MASGVKCHDSVGERYNCLYKKKETSYCVFKLNKALNEIIVDEDVDKAFANNKLVEFPDLCAEITKTGEPRYIVYDVNYELPNSGGKRRKILFIFWCNDNTTPVRQKMVYAASKSEMKKLEGVQDDVQANEFDELHCAVDDFIKQQIDKGK